MQLAQDKFWPWATPQLLLLFPWHWQSEFSQFYHPHNLFVAVIMAPSCGFRSSRKTWHVQYYVQLPGLAPHPLPLDHLPPGPSTDQQSVQQNVSKTSRDQCLALAILLSDTHGFLIHCSLNGVQAEHKNAELASEKNTLNRWSANVWMTRMTVSWWKKSSKKLLVSKKLLSQSKILTLSWHSPRASKPLLGSAKCKPCLGMRLRVVGIPPWLQPAHHTTLHIDVHGSWVWKHFGGLIYLDHAYFSTKKVLRGCLRRSQSLIYDNVVVYLGPWLRSSILLFTHGLTDCLGWGISPHMDRSKRTCPPGLLLRLPLRYQAFASVAPSWQIQIMKGFAFPDCIPFSIGVSRAYQKTRDVLHSVANIELDIFESTRLSWKKTLLLCCCPHHHLLLQG